MTPPAFYSAALAALPGIRHGFFGRRGGVSTGAYASLNAGAGSRDDPAAIGENRARIAGAMGVAPDHLLSLYQVHSASALRVDRVWDNRPEADAHVTKTPGLALTALAADCTQVLFADVGAGVIGAAHAGWRGALNGVLEAAVAEMERAGASRARIVAAIGPCIRAESYEVGAEFETAFAKANAGSARFFAPGRGDRLQFDLPGFCADALKSAGVNTVDVIAVDTYTSPADLFSYRRAQHLKEADCGRNCAAIVLTGEA